MVKKATSEKVTAYVYSADNSNGPITVELAETWLKQNLKNRPRRMELVKRYAMEIIRGKWTLNGEAIIFDWDGHLISGQHRLAAVILAEEWRQSNPKAYRKYGWRGPITLDAVVVDGVDPKTADTVDLGQKRTGGDVLFRQSRFDEKKYKPAQVKTLSNDLATAVRLVWLRNQKMVVSDAPKFPHSEMLDFLKEHTGIKTWVEAVFEKDAGSDKNISSRVSRAYMAAMLYLYETSFENESEGDIKATEFLNEFADGAGLAKTDPVFVLREAFVKLRDGSGASSGAGRDVICGMLVKAMQFHAAGESCKPADLKIKKGEDPRLGGFDRSREEVEAEIAADEEEEAEEVVEE
jgi:hypothetical protein